MPNTYTHPGVYIEEILEHVKSIENTPTSIVGFIGVISDLHVDIDKPYFVNNWNGFTSAFGRHHQDAPFLASAVENFFLNGGKECYIVPTISNNPQELIGTITDTGIATGLKALESIEDISIVVLPGISDIEVHKELLSHCEKMGNRIAILDLKEDASIEDAQEHKKLLSSKLGFGALYYPWINTTTEILKENEEPIRKEISSPPSGAIAGIYARVDTEQGVHKAPANEALSNVLSFTKDITQDEQDILNITGINALRSFYGRGNLVWGARSLATNPDFKYISTFRLFLHLKMSIYKSTQWTVFEVNDEQMWTTIRLSIESFLQTYWQHGALQGETPQVAYFVKCDQETMSQSDIESGKLIIQIGIAPLKPAEFIRFEIIHTTA